MKVYVLYNPSASWDYMIVGVYETIGLAEIAKEEHPDCEDLEITTKTLEK